MTTSKQSNYITSMHDLVKQKQALQLRLREQENELRKRVNQVPGEMFYASVDRVIPSFLSGKVSSFALNAGKGLINNFFVRRAVEAGSLKLLNVVKPSGLMRRVGTAFKSLRKKK